MGGPAVSMDRTDAADCRGKLPYPTIAAARRAAREAQKRQRNGPLKAFFCPHCQNFHIGRRPKADVVAAKIRRFTRMRGAHGDVRI